MDASVSHLFRPRRAVRVMSGGGSSSGAAVDFYLPEEPGEEEVKLARIMQEI